MNAPPAQADDISPQEALDALPKMQLSPQGSVRALIDTPTPTADERKISSATDYYKQHAEEFWGPGSQAYAIDRVPVAGTMVTLAHYYDLSGAMKRYKAGTHTDDDLYKIAQHNAETQYDNERSQSFGNKAFDFATHAPGLVAEFALSGGATAGIKESVAEGASRYLGKKVIADVALAGGRAIAEKGPGLAARALGSGVQTAAMTALTPSMYIDRAARSNVEKGRDPLDPRGLAPAYGLAASQMAVMGAVGELAPKALAKYTGINFQGGGVANIGGRISLQAVTGPFAQAAADVVTSTVGLDSGFGTIGKVLHGHFGEALQDAALQSMQFATFGGAHELVAGVKGRNHEKVMQAFADAAKDLSDKGVGQDSAGRILQTPAEIIDAIHKADPNASRDDVERAMQQLPEGPLRDLGMQMAQQIPKHQAPQGPTPGIDELPPEAPANRPTGRFGPTPSPNGTPAPQGTAPEGPPGAPGANGTQTPPPAPGSNPASPPPQQLPPDVPPSTVPPPAIGSRIGTVGENGTAIDTTRQTDQVRLDRLRANHTDAVQKMNAAEDSRQAAVRNGRRIDAAGFEQQRDAWSKHIEGLVNQISDLQERMNPTPPAGPVDELGNTKEQLGNATPAERLIAMFEEAGLTPAERHVLMQRTGDAETPSRTLEDIGTDVKELGGKKGRKAFTKEGVRRIEKRALKKLMATLPEEQRADAQSLYDSIIKPDVASRKKDLNEPTKPTSTLAADVESHAGWITDPEGKFQDEWAKRFAELKESEQYTSADAAGKQALEAHWGQLYSQANATRAEWLGKLHDLEASDAYKAGDENDRKRLLDSLTQQFGAATAKRGPGGAETVRSQADAGLQPHPTPGSEAAAAEAARGQGLGGSAGTGQPQAAGDGLKDLPEATKKLVADVASSGNKYYLRYVLEEVERLYGHEVTPALKALVKATPRATEPTGYEGIGPKGRGTAAQANGMIIRGELRDELIRHQAGDEYEDAKTQLARAGRTAAQAEELARQTLSESVRSGTQSGKAAGIEEVARDSGHSPEELEKLLDASDAAERDAILNEPAGLPAGDVHAGEPGANGAAQPAGGAGPGRDDIAAWQEKNKQTALPGDQTSFIPGIYPEGRGTQGELFPSGPVPGETPPHEDLPGQGTFLHQGPDVPNRQNLPPGVTQVAPGVFLHVDEAGVKTLRSAAPGASAAGTVAQANALPIGEKMAEAIGAGILRHRNAQRVRRADQAATAFSQGAAFYEGYIEAQTPAVQTARFLDFFTPIEHGAIDQLPDDQRPFAEAYREWKDVYTKLLTDRDLVKATIENHVGHLWRDPQNPNATPQDIAAKLASRRPLAGREGFRKMRVLDYFEDGIAAGLIPVEMNPMKYAMKEFDQYNKSIFGHDSFNEAKEQKLAKYVPLGSRAPDGWRTLPDKLWRVLAPGETNVREYYDKQQMEGLEKFADDLGIEHSRVGRGLPPGAAGQARIELPEINDALRRMHPGMTDAEIGARLAQINQSAGGGGLDAKASILTKYGTPEEILAHEIGHVLDIRYGMSDWLRDPLINQELTHLADLRSSQRVSGDYSAYLRAPEEKMANLVAAYLHAPELLNQVAPNAMAHFEALLGQQPELRAFRDIKPSLELGQRDQVMRLAGPMLTGHYFMPDKVATLFENHMSPGLSGTKVAGVPLYDYFRGVGNQMSQFILGWSAFHTVGTSLNAQFSAIAEGMGMAARGDFDEAMRKVPESIVPLAAAGKGLSQGGKLRSEWDLPGSQSPEVQQMTQWLEEAGARARGGSEYFGTSLQSVRTALNRINAGDKSQIPKALLLALPALNQLVSKPTMDYLVPLTKQSVAADAIRYEMSKNPNMDLNTRREVFGKIWDAMDDRFGLLTYDNLFLHRVMRDGLQAAFLSFGWNLGDVRGLGGGIKDTFTPSMWQGLSKGEGISRRTAFLTSMIVGTAMYGALYQLAATGKGPEEPKDLFFPKTGRTRPDGTLDRVSFPTYMKDLAAAGNRAGDSPLQIPANLYHMGKGKLNPALHLVAELLDNEDWKGSAIANPNESWAQQGKDQAQHILKAFIPISLQQLVNPQDKAASVGQRAQGFAGITPAPSRIVNTMEQQRQKETNRKVILTPLAKKAKGR